MLDWMSLSIEAIGIAILLIWIIVPIREFQAIFKRLKQENAQRKQSAGRDN